MSLPEPDFIQRDPVVVTAEIIAQYEQITRKTLYPAQVERILIDIISYRETLIRIGIQEAAKQNLLSFARAPMLDYLGELVGVTRLQPQNALIALRISVATPMATAAFVDGGTRVTSNDGAIQFFLNERVEIPAGQLYVDTKATCAVVGVIGNGWQLGQINQWYDDPGNPNLTVLNTSISSGGTEVEDDEHLRESIRLAPEAFSTAGSRGAYKYHALRSHQDIVDVAVITPSPGVVALYPLTKNALPTEEILSLVSAACSADRVRPLTDHVVALAPTQISYEINATIKVLKTSDISDVQKNVLSAANMYAQERSSALCLDIVPSQLIAALQVNGVYQVNLISPTHLVLQVHEWAKCTNIQITVDGVMND